MTGYEWLIVAGLIIAGCTATVLLWIARAPLMDQTGTRHIDSQDVAEAPLGILPWDDEDDNKTENKGE